MYYRNAVIELNDFNAGTCIRRHISSILTGQFDEVTAAMPMILRQPPTEQVELIFWDMFILWYRFQLFNQMFRCFFDFFVVCMI